MFSYVTVRILYMIFLICIWKICRVEQINIELLEGKKVTMGIIIEKKRACVHKSEIGQWGDH